MLFVEFRNTTKCSPVSNYEVNVWVNCKKIGGPFKVNGHERAKGWLPLVKQFVQECEAAGVDTTFQTEEKL